jgi:hypothetical protein
MLHVGQKVVYVDDNYRRGVKVLPTETLPKLGCVIPCRELYGLDEDGLRLVEIVYRPRQLLSSTAALALELAFRVSRFRPVTNIDVFLAMLEPTHVGIRGERINARMKQPLRSVPVPPVAGPKVFRRAEILEKIRKRSVSAGKHHSADGLAALAARAFLARSRSDLSIASSSTSLNQL